MVTFDRFRFDPGTLELYRDGLRVHLQQQPARVLGMLLARRGQLITREELRQAIWGADTFVDFNRSLNFCISQIRAALDDNAEVPRFVETLRGRGYRFVGEQKATADAPVAARTAEGRPVLRRYWFPLTVAAALVLAPAIWAISTLGERATMAVAVAPFDASSGSEAWSNTLHTQIVAHLAHGRTRVIEPAATNRTPGRAWSLEGRVDRSDEQYRVTVTLRDAKGAVRFSDIFDGPPGDWIEAQNEMARIISQAVRYNVEGPESTGGIERRAPRRKIPFS